MADEALHPLTNDLVDRFALALKEKLLASQIKYGWADDWARDDWQERCQASLLDHIGKGDPRDVAAFAAFMWHHDWPTATREGMATAKLPDHAKRFLAYMCAYHRAYVGRGGVSLHSEAANDSIDEIMELVPQEYLDLDFYIPDFGGSDGPWKCFHCNALFEDRDAATRHFGENEDVVAACLIELAPKADSALVGDLREKAATLLANAVPDADDDDRDLVEYSRACNAILAALSDRDVVLEGLLREARAWVFIAEHDEHCELHPDYGEQNLEAANEEAEQKALERGGDERDVRYRTHPEDAVCTCERGEILARIDAALKGGVDG